MFIGVIPTEEAAYKLGVLDRIAEEKLGYYRNCPFDFYTEEALWLAWQYGKYLKNKHVYFTVKGER